MKIPALSLLVAFLLGNYTFAQQIPEGYLLQYQQGFNDSKALTDFDFNHSGSWGIFKNKNNSYIQCSAVKIDSAFPGNRAILRNRILGDFILELDVISDTIDKTSGEICIFLGFTDSTRYYFVQLGNSPMGNDQGIYVVNKSVKTRLTGNSEQTLTWSGNKWHKISIRRNIVKRTILVFADDLPLPVLQIKDYELVMGAVGIGSFSGQCKFDNIKIWSPTVIPEE